MELLLNESSRIEVCAIIDYLTVLDVTDAAVEWKIKEVYREVIFQKMINRWCTMFPNGRTDLNNDACQRWSVIDGDTINTVYWLFLGILKLVQRYNKCFYVLGDYVEK